MAEPRHVSLAMVPLFVPAVSLAGGVAAGFLLGLAVRVQPAMWAAWALFACVLSAGVWGALRGKMRVAAATVAFLCGLTSVALRGVAPAPTAGGVTLNGEVISTTEYPDCQRLVVRGPDGCRYMVNLRDYDWLVVPGEQVRVSGMVLPSLLEPGVPSERTSNTFVKARFIAGRIVPADRGFEVTAPARGLQRALNRARTYSQGLIADSGVDQPTQQLLDAVLLGNDAVGDEIRSDFSRAGLSHVLALSGTHVATLVLFISMLLMPVELVGGGRTAKWLLMLLLWGYALLTGLSPSVVRAVVMASCLLAGKMSGRQVSPFNSLCAAAILILLFDPGALLSVGFQLSFAAVAGILMFMPMITGRIYHTRAGRHSAVRFLVQLFCLPVVAVVATTPLSAWYFHNFPVWFLLANIPVALLLPPMLCCGLSLMLFLMAGLPHVWLTEACERLCEAVTWTASTVSSLPGADAGQGVCFAWWLMIPAYATLVMVWIWWNLGRRVWLGCASISLVATLLLWPAAQPTPPKNEWYVWDNAPGVTVVVQRRGRIDILTDVNPRYYTTLQRNAGEQLCEFLLERRAESLTVSGGDGQAGVGRPGGVLWELPGCRCLVVGNSEVHPSAKLMEKADAVIVSGGFRGDVLELSARAGERRLVLSGSLPPQRRRRYARELREAGRPFTLRLYPPGDSATDTAL